MLFRNWIINARIGKGNQRDFFPIRSSLRVLQNSLSFFRVYDKCLLYCVLWTEWGFRYLSAFFHCRKRWKVLRQTFFQSQPNDFSFSAKRFFVLSQTIFQSAATDFRLWGTRFSPHMSEPFLPLLNYNLPQTILDWILS